MDEQVLERMLSNETITADDILRMTAAERVDGMVEMLLRHLPYDEVRSALCARIRGAPLADYKILRLAHFKYCDHVPAIASAIERSVLSGISPETTSRR